MNRSLRNPNIWLWFTAPIAVLLATASGAGVFVDGLYRDAPSLATQAVAQDFVSLAVVLPVFVTAAVLARRGSLQAVLVWLGCLVYLVYCYVLAAFDVKFNPLFLVYVSLLGCSLYALIGGFLTVDLAGIKARFKKTAPTGPVSVYLALLAILFYSLWLSEIVPALVAGSIPQSVLDDGTPTNPVHVVDMAWILPAFAITAVSLWRKQPLGYTLAGAMLSYVVLLILAILAMIGFMIRNGHPVVAPEVVIFGTVFAISLGMLTWLLTGLKSPHTWGDEPSPAPKRPAGFSL